MRARVLAVAAALLLGLPAAGSAAGIDEETRAEISRITLLLIGADEPADDFIIPSEAQRRSVERGVLSAMLDRCGAEWETASYQLFMAYARSSKKFDEEQMAALGFFHGFTMETAQDEIGDRNGDWCSPARIAALKALAAQPQSW